jgi:hypothetical protein
MRERAAPYVRVLSQPGRGAPGPASIHQRRIRARRQGFRIFDPSLRADHLGRLASAGIDAAAAERTGQFELLNWEDAYFRGGHFDKHSMPALMAAA